MSGPDRNPNREAIMNRFWIDCLWFLGIIAAIVAAYWIAHGWKNLGELLDTGYLIGSGIVLVLFWILDEVRAIRYLIQGIYREVKK
jgi:hypothetical protein